MEIQASDILKPGYAVTSVPEFAATHGVATETVYYAIKNGGVDYVNFGTDAAPVYQVVLTDHTRSYSPNKHKSRA